MPSVSSKDQQRKAGVAVSIRDELLQLQNENEILQAQTVVDWAADNPDSDIYNSLEWNDGEAAKNWRLWQVRRLIAIHVVDVEQGHRTLISLSTDRVKEGGGYRGINDVIAMPDLRDIMLQDAFKDLDRLQKKYTRLQELCTIWDEANRVRARTARRRGRPRRVQEGPRASVYE